MLDVDGKAIMFNLAPSKPSGRPKPSGTRRGFRAANRVLTEAHGNTHEKVAEIDVTDEFGTESICQIVCRTTRRNCTDVEFLEPSIPPPIRKSRLASDPARLSCWVIAVCFALGRLGKAPPVTPLWRNAVGSDTDCEILINVNATPRLESPRELSNPSRPASR
jgi:hypothetical protein